MFAKGKDFIMNYKIVKCSLKPHNIESHLNKYAKEGWKFKSIVLGKGWFRPCTYVIMER